MLNIIRLTRHTCLRVISLCALLLLLTGCNTTPYQPLRENGGYSSRPFPNGTLIVVFEGLMASNQNRYTDYAILRAAELTQKAGFKYFVIENQSVEEGTAKARYSGTPAKTETTTTYIDTNNPEHTRTITRTTHTPATPDQLIDEPRHWITLHVRMLRTPNKISSQDKVFEVDATIKQIRKKYSVRNTLPNLAS